MNTTTIVRLTITEMKEEYSSIIQKYLKTKQKANSEKDKKSVESKYKIEDYIRYISTRDLGSFPFPYFFDIIVQLYAVKSSASHSISVPLAFYLRCIRNQRI